MKNERVLIILAILMILLSIFLTWEIYQISGEVLVTTDKTEYEKSEVLRMKVQNNFRKNVCFSSCYPYLLEKKTEEWKFYPYEACPKTDVIETCIGPGQEKFFEITLSSLMQDGLHRVAIPVCIGCEIGEDFKEDRGFYSNEFIIGKEIACNWCGSACLKYPIGEEDCLAAGGVFDKQCACPEVAPSEGFICVKENDKCLAKSKEIDKIVNWKIYRNEKHWYEIEYPENWEIKEDSNGNAEFIAQAVTVINIDFISQEILDTMGIAYCGAYPEDKNRCEEITINNTRYVIEKDSDYESILIENPDGGALSIILKSLIGELGTIFRKVLSTFRFLE